MGSPKRAITYYKLYKQYNVKDYQKPNIEIELSVTELGPIEERVNSGEANLDERVTILEEHMRVHNDFSYMRLMAYIFLGLGFLGQFIISLSIF